MAEPRSREYWQEVSERRLPAEDQILNRNRAITAAYARWCEKRTDLHEWAGMAAFSAWRTRHYLRRYLQRRKRLESWEARRTDATLRRLEWFRRVENRIYRDTAWIYDACEVEGFAGVANLLKGLPDPALMIDAVHELHQAESGGDTAGRHARRGNERLFRHVEEHTVQPLLHELDWRSALYLSRTSEVQFGTNGGWARGARSSFAGFMLTRGTPELVRSCSPPDITRLRHRWYWIEHSVIPLWRKQVAGADPDLGTKIQQMIGEGPDD